MFRQNLHFSWDRDAWGQFPDLHGTRILLVDDEPDSLDLLRFVLAQLGAEVTAVSSAREAFAEIDRSIPDVLVSDVAMPEQDGLGLIAELRSRKKDPASRIPAIALTAFSQKEDRDRALAAGFQVHLAKPIDPLKLAWTVAKLGPSK